MANRAHIVELPWIMIVLSLLMLVSITAAVNAQQSKPKVLFATMSGWPKVDCTYRDQLINAGYTVGGSYYESLDPSQGNVVVLTMFGPDSYPFKSDGGAAIRSYVQNGGGLLLMLGYSGYGDIAALVSSINSFLQPMGGQILWERAEDPQNSQVFSWSVDYTYYSTSNITRGLCDAVTNEVNSIWYPGGKHSSDVSSYTMSLNSDWQVLLRGMSSANSASIASQPPLLAVRNYGQGRIAIAAWDARYCVADGKHPAYGDYMLGRADCAKLLTNLYDWLGAPSIALGKTFVSSDASDCGQQQPVTQPQPEAAESELIRQADAAPAHNTYKGIIGVRSSISGGQNTVAEFCQAARANGLSFLVFSELYDNMTDAKWSQLVSECQAASTATFSAIPGIRINDPNSADRVIFNLSRFPTPEEAATWHLILFNCGWPTAVMCKPDISAQVPWYIKFYVGLAAYTYDSTGTMVDDATGTYQSLVASDYRLVPVVVNDILSTAGVQAATSRFLTYTNADSPAGIANSMKTFDQSGSSYVSNGPVIDKFGLYGGAEPGQRMMLNIAATSSAPITEVALYRAGSPIQKFYPNQTSFSTRVWLNCDRNAAYTITVKDSNGKEAVSNSVRTFNKYFNYTMCVDKQNSIINTAGDIIPCGFISGFDVGAMYVVAPPKEMAPFGEDVTWAAISSVETAPQLWMQSGSTPPAFTKIGYTSRRGDLSTSDVIVSTNYLDDQYASGTSRYTLFRPKVYGNNIILVDTEIVLKNAVTLASRTEGPEVVMFRAMSSTAVKLYTDYSVIWPNGSKSNGKINSNTTLSGYIPSIKTFMGKGSCFTLWPNRVGNLAVYPLDAQTYSVASGVTTEQIHAFVSGSNKYRNYVEVGFEMPGRSLTAGTVLRAKLLIVLDNGNTTPFTGFDQIRNGYCLNGTSGYTAQVSNGSILDRTYILSLQAQNNKIGLTVPAATLPDERLPFSVTRLNDKWDAGVYDKVTKVVKRIGVLNGVGYGLLDAAADNDLMIGNLATSDIPGLVLTVRRLDNECMTVIAHNPGTSPVTGKVGCMLSAEKLPVTLGAGETTELRFFLRPGTSTEAEGSGSGVSAG